MTTEAYPGTSPSWSGSGLLSATPVVPADSCKGIRNVFHRLHHSRGIFKLFMEGDFVKNIIYIALIFILAACGTSAVIPDVEDKDVAELDLHAASNAKPIQLSKVVVKLKRGEHVGAIQAGLACIPHGDLQWKGGRLNLSSDELTEAFQEELEKYSFRVVGDTDALFEDPSNWKSEILVAGLIKQLNANICFPWAGFGNFSTSKGEAYVKVEWQIYSKLDRSVVHKASTEGAFKQSDTQTGGGESIIIDAFAQAARNLLADEKFRNITLRGGEKVKESVIKSADNLLISPGNAKALGSDPADWKDGVVTIFAGSGHGSGFVVGEDLVVTNHHVVGESEKVVVKFGSGFEVNGTVIAYNSGFDVAVVKVDATLPRYFKMEKSLPNTGASVYAVGSPLSEEFSTTVSSGIVSGVREIDNRKYIQSDVNVQPGNSGGPLLNSFGHVIGITVSGIRLGGASTGINFFIPIDAAMRTMNIVL